MTRRNILTDNILTDRLKAGIANPRREHLRQGLASVFLVAMLAIPLLCAGYLRATRTGMAVIDHETVQARHYAQAILEGIARLNYSESVSFSSLPEYLSEYSEKTRISCRATESDGLSFFFSGSSAGANHYAVITTEKTSLTLPTANVTKLSDEISASCDFSDYDAYLVTVEVYYKDETSPRISLGRHLIKPSYGTVARESLLDEDAGYVILESGYIFQWGTFTENATGRTLLVFPYAWPESMEYIGFLEDASDGVTSETNFSLDLGGGLGAVDLDNIGGESVHIVGPPNRTAKWFAYGR